MLDIKFVRMNPDVVKQNIKNKFQDEKLPLVDEVLRTGSEKQRNQTGSRSASCETEIKFPKKSVHAWHRAKKKKQKRLKKKVAGKCR